MERIEIENLIEGRDKLVSIDPLSLDHEWLSQSFLTMKYNEALADIIKEREMLRASLDEMFREEIKKGGAKKITEAAVQAKINGNMEFIELDYQVALLKSIVEGFNHRKKALEKLVELTLGGYNSLPNQPRTFDNWNQAKLMKVDQDQKMRLNRNRIRKENND